MARLKGWQALLPPLPHGPRAPTRPRRLQQAEGTTQPPGPLVSQAPGSAAATAVATPQLQLPGSYLWVGCMQLLRQLLVRMGLDRQGRPDRQHLRMRRHLVNNCVTAGHLGMP
jgi:hypothetical protein